MTDPEIFIHMNFNKIPLLLTDIVAQSDFRQLRY